MPITIEPEAPNLFTLHWKGVVTLDEIDASHAKTLESVQASGITRYIHIIVLTEVTTYPRDLIGLWEILKKYPQVIAVIAVTDKPIIRRMANVVASIARRARIELRATLDEARERAHELLVSTDPQRVPH